MIAVLHIVGDTKFGGACRIILRLAAMARSEGQVVDILATDPVFQTEIRKVGFGLVSRDWIRREIRPVFDTWGLYRLYRFLATHPYDVVHTHTSKGGFLGRVAARLAGVPIIIHTAHGFAIHESSPLSHRLAYTFLERIAGACCDRIVCVSQFHRGWALRLGMAAEGKLLAIPNGIETDRVAASRSAAETRAQLGVGAHEWFVLSHGRLAPQKGLEDLIHAVHYIAPSTRLPLRVVLAGEGPLRPSLEKLVAGLGLEQSVVFAGFREDIGNLLAACDVVVLPSLREGLSISLLEAMAAGRPIVATSIGSNRELCSAPEAALLVPPRSPQLLASAVRRCLTDQALAAELAANARRIFQQRYTEARMVETYRLLYRQLLAKLAPLRTTRLAGASLQHPDHAL